MAANASGGAAGVRVRMYRQGLGDCFLISFPKEDGSRFHLMIDCGVILGTPDPEPIMRAVAESIHAETGGRVDVLVATHEHWDHLSGFVQADGVFDTLAVGEVWLAWTEDPGHPLANELRQERRKNVAHLNAAVARMAGDAEKLATAARPAEAAAFRSMALGVGEVLGFFGDLGAGKEKSTQAALEYLTTKKGAPVRFHRPGGEALPLPGVPKVKVYVLGPPEDRVLIRKSDPTRRGRETYEHPALSLADSFYAALGVDASGLEPEDGGLDADAVDLGHPFDRKHRILDASASDHVSFFARYYGLEEAGVSPWRRIESDWMGAAADLALALDSDTNNTSLALAFELGEDGPVLLFPADAQVGNWLSWDGHAWPRDPRDPERGRVDAADLLRRTVLYKVGHHGSHNATLREKGLERMESPELVALIPVDEAMATKKRWTMPFGPLYQRLKEKTRGRLLRVDAGRLSKDEARAHGLTDGEWERWVKRTPEDETGGLGGRPLWIDVSVDF